MSSSYIREVLHEGIMQWKSCPLLITLWLEIASRSWGIFVLVEASKDSSSPGGQKIEKSSCNFVVRNTNDKITTAFPPFICLPGELLSFEASPMLTDMFLCWVFPTSWYSSTNWIFKSCDTIIWCPRIMPHDYKKGIKILEPVVQKSHQQNWNFLADREWYQTLTEFSGIPSEFMFKW